MGMRNTDLEALLWQHLAETANKTLEKERIKTIGEHEL